MHTTICAFDDRAQAEEAMERLVRAGFPRHDMYVDHRAVTGSGRRRWGSSLPQHPEDGGAMKAFGRFMATLLGEEDPGYADTYSQHVERGSFVLVVDARDEAQAEQVRNVLAALQADDLNVVHRTEQRPLRDIVGMPQARNDWVERSRESWNEAWRQDRAVASDRRGQDAQRPPGLRYFDQDGKDKPNR
jgi:hypothetical protein